MKRTVKLVYNADKVTKSKKDLTKTITFLKSAISSQSCEKNADEGYVKDMDMLMAELSFDKKPLKEKEDQDMDDYADEDYSDSASESDEEDEDGDLLMKHAFMV